MAWAENNYIETRFVKGMNCSVEPHTLDRDTGELPDIMNMVCRTQGLRTRKGWVRVDDLSKQFSVLPTYAPSGLFLFEPVLPEDAQEESEEGGESGGTPTINPSDLIGGGGSIGGGGGIKPKPTEEEEEVAPVPSEAWTLAASAATVMPYVPFDLTITCVSGVASEPRWLQGSLLPTSYKGSYSGDPGNLSHTSTNVWKRTNVMVRNLNRSITNVKYKAGPSSSVYADCQVAYALYSFIPNLPSGVVTGTRFDYTVTCVSGGSTVTNYKGQGRGVELRWKFYDADGLLVSGAASSAGGTWNNGVLSGTCVIGNTNATRVVLEVEFLGEVNTASANIVQATPSLSISVTEQLHIYGGAGVLSIEVTDEYSGTIRPSIQMTAVDSSDENVRFSDWFEDENGNLIDLTQGWTHSGNVWNWSGSIRAKSSRSAETITLRATYKNSEAATATVEVLDGLSGELDAPEFILSGVAFEIAASVLSDAAEAVPRLYSDRLSLRKVSGALQFSSEISTDWEFGEPSWEAVYSCTLTGTGNAVIGLYYEDILLTTCEIIPMAVMDALIEAINERYQAKGSSARVSANDSASTIRSAAIDAIGGYAKGAIGNNGSFTAFNSDNHGIPAITEEEWEAATYVIVRSAKIRHIDLDKYGDTGSGTSNNVRVEKVGDEWDWATAISTAKSQAVSNFAWNGAQANPRARIRTIVDEYDYSSSRKEVHASVYMERFGLMMQSLPGVSCTISAYGGVGKMNDETFDKFGYNIPDYGDGGLMGTWEQSSNGPIRQSGYLGVNPTPRFSGNGTRGFYYEKWQYANAEYHFKHK